MNQDYFIFVFCLVVHRVQPGAPGLMLLWRNSAFCQADKQRALQQDERERRQANRHLPFKGWTKAYWLTEKPHCIDFTILKENWFEVELRNVNKLINKPFQIIFSILMCSSLHMNWAYAALEGWYDLAIRLLYTDTDSLIIHVNINDLYKNILDVPVFRELRDLSEPPAIHPSGVGESNCPNKAIPSKIKVVCHLKIVWRDCAIVTCNCAIVTQTLFINKT